MEYIPSGSMCMGCIHRKRDCSALPFNAMPRLKDYGDGVTKVRCTGYEKEK